MVKMKHIISGAILAMMLTACTDDGEEQSNESENENLDDNEGEEEEQELSKLPLKENDNEFVSAADLVDTFDGSYSYDELHRTLEVSIMDETYKMIYDVPVLEHNGEYIANEEVKFEVEDEDVYLSLEFLNEGLGLAYEADDDEVRFSPTEKSTPAYGEPADFTFEEEEWDAEQMSEYLAFLQSPIEGAEVSTVESHLPGAPRDYRNGEHEGIDWYEYGTEVEITTDTEIYGMADGTVVRADHDYEEYSSPEERDEDLALAADADETPEYILDRLRGKQVWVQYENGVMNRFAHLHDIPDDIQVGDTIDEETVIGYVGNSGTSHAVKGDEMGGLHLHQDLLIYGDLFYEPLNEEEVIDVLQQIF
ncbi:M23 family metallopeptidase [Salsuginibacillus kocurii]|uniref:M23 family metallopeptidase n=1 Tax=Salsuginibacillus kocurii TaxID=427078 RepID=UPI00036AF45F|nr:M23 family metallopeptidase [Salsuginibacillus kocurii]